MSVDCLIRRVFTPVAFVLSFFSLAGWNAAQARDLSEMISTPFVDPLRTRPGILENGSILPGDAFVVDCNRREIPPQPLALVDAVDMALCNNPQIRETWTGIKMQAANLGQAESAYLPTSNVSYGRMHTGTSYPGSAIASTSTTGDTVYSSLNWRIFDFGTRAANRSSANSLLIAAINDHEATLQKVLAQTVQSYFDVQTARADLQAKKEIEKIAIETLESAARREARGVSAHGDTLQATTARAKASLEKSRALGDYQKAVATLVYEMGLSAESDVATAEEAEIGSVGRADSDIASQLSGELNQWLKTVASSHPAILAARAKWKAAQSATASTRAEGLPTIDFSAGYNQNGYPGQGMQANLTHVNTIGVSISIPLFDGFSHTYKVRSAEAQAEQREAEMEDVEHSVLAEVVKAHSDVVASVQNIDASRVLLEAAEEALATTKRKYEKGAADILEILSTQSALADALQERVRCLSALRSARLRFMADSGKLGMTSIRASQ